MNAAASSLPAVLTALLLLTWLGCRTVPPEPIPSAQGEFTWGVALEGEPITPEQLAQTRTTMGHPYSLVVFFMAWPARGDVPGQFPRATLDAIHAEGALPCLTWEPMHLQQGHETAISAKAILSGEYDAFLSAFADATAHWKKPLLIRFAHEMNLSRYHWGGTQAEYGPSSPARYKELFRYVVHHFRKHNATNVLWAFCPNTESVPQESWNTIGAYYPGGDVVDYLGLDGYNWGPTQTVKHQGWNSRWQTFEEIFSKPHAELRTLCTHKPLLIFETASVDIGGHQSRWLAEGLQTARSLGITGMAWFQAKKENDWCLRPASAHVLRHFMQDKRVR